MSNLSYLRTATLENYLAGDGQRFTDLIKQWASVYFRRCSIATSEHNIDGTSFRKDGGIDGWVDAIKSSDPEGFIDRKSVFQFKAGMTTKEDAEKELTKKSKNGSPRIDDYIKKGHKLVWFLGRGLAEKDVKQLESDLAEIVEKIQPGSLKPSVIDANRLCQYLSRTPALACRLANADGLFLTSDVALEENPHARFKKFVPGSHFMGLQEDIKQFLTNPANRDQVKYIAGEPGIGKSRSVLEAVEGIPDLAGRVCYFSDQTNIKAFFSFARQEAWSGYCIVDEYIGTSLTTDAITSDTIPKNFKAILIGHAHKISLKDARVEVFENLTEAEMVNALKATFDFLEDFRIREAIRLSRQNLRLARSICDFISKDPGADLGLKGLEGVVDDEFDKMESPTGRRSLGYLSLVPMLVRDNLDKFCTLTGLDKEAFLKDCQALKDRSGFVQTNDQTLYVGALALSFVALIHLWRTEPDNLTKVFKAPGEFLDDIISTVKRLPQCPEKEQMLDFFRVPVANLTLSDLLDGEASQRLYHLLVADPESYLPAIHRVVMENCGKLSEFPYETAGGSGRRDLIWRLRDLAQFGEYFEMAEQIVYWFALEEIPTAYHNNASDYWSTWFGALFDNTTYPYEKRLALLASRIEQNNPVVNELVATAIANPFPDIGREIPSERVGGRLAPPELRFIHTSQLALAATRLPAIIERLLETGSTELRSSLAKDIVEASFRWLEIGALEQYSQIVMSPYFPAGALQDLIVKVRYFVNLETTHTNSLDAVAKTNISRHSDLLKRINREDIALDILEIGENGYWTDDQTDSLYVKQLKIAQTCKNDSKVLDQVLELLSDPAKGGGSQLGLMLSSVVSFESIQGIVEKAWSIGLSQFSYALLKGFFESHPELVIELMKEVRLHELESTRTAVTLYQALGEKIYRKEAARLLNETDVSSDFMGRFWTRSAEDFTDDVWQIVRAIKARLTVGDESSQSVALNIAADLSRHDLRNPEAIDYCLDVLRLVSAKRNHATIQGWDKIGIWLLETNPNEMIKIAGSKEQSEYSHATTVLASAAPMHPLPVLDSLVEILANPYGSSVLLGGGLVRVFQNLPTDIFLSWLVRQKIAVKERVAAHLPKPILENGIAKVPEITRAYWATITPKSKAFKRAMDFFTAHTLNTGVYTGFGVDLYSNRVTMSKQLLLDSSDSIRLWAKDSLAANEYFLARAKERADLDEARENTRDRS